VERAELIFCRQIPDSRTAPEGGKGEKKGERWGIHSIFTELRLSMKMHATLKGEKKGKKKRGRKRSVNSYGIVKFFPYDAQPKA